MQYELERLLGGQTPTPKRGGKVRRTMSPEARAKIGAAQRKRWAKQKRAKV